MPCPFTRVLYPDSTNQPAGNDVIILQNLLNRSPLTARNLSTDGLYDEQTAIAVSQVKSAHGLPDKSVFDEAAAEVILRLYMLDGYKDDGTILKGYKYKVHVPVHRNRSIETQATLYDANMRVLHTFTARSHGQNLADGTAMNMLCGSGNTPTGLMTFDLNSPEPDPVSYGPYPVNRAVQGLEGNAKFLISDIRDGILLHTGEWANWQTWMPMPNSHGCIHAHPEDIKTIWQILVHTLNVTVHPNTGGKLPYPYTPQGILSVETID